MLSILIPVYNYDVRALVLELHKQCSKCQIDFEILVQDDSSTIFKNENSSINSLDNCSFNLLKNNIGRSAIRNLLAKNAKYNDLLFLDADVQLIGDFFILNYLSKITNEEKIVYGGIQYQIDKPEKDKILRWTYGNAKEALTVDKRKKQNYLSFLTLNFLIKKSIFDTVSFNENIPNLRHEDTLFSFDLMTNKIKIEHIDNPILHLGLDFNIDFVTKSEQAIDNLKYLIDNKLIDSRYVKMSALVFDLKKYKVQLFVSSIYRTIKPLLLKNIYGKNPSLLLFDFYRVGYFCTIYKR